jgi:hypothetical protein
MRQRPQDFYGPEDWSGDEEYDRKMIALRQEEWDKEFQALPWWRKLWFDLTGS